MYGRCKDKLVLVARSSKKVYVSIQKQIKTRQVFRYLEFKMDCAATAEKVGWKLDVELAQKCVADLTKQKADKEAELISVMPKRKVTTKKSRPKNCFRKRWYCISSWTTLV